MTMPNRASPSSAEPSTAMGSSKRRPSAPSTSATTQPMMASTPSGLEDAHGAQPEEDHARRGRVDEQAG